MPESAGEALHNALTKACVPGARLAWDRTEQRERDTWEEAARVFSDWLDRFGVEAETSK